MRIPRIQKKAQCTFFTSDFAKTISVREPVKIVDNEDDEYSGYGSYDEDESECYNEHRTIEHMKLIMYSDPAQLNLITHDYLLQLVALCAFNNRSYIWITNDSIKKYINYACECYRIDPIFSDVYSEGFDARSIIKRQMRGVFY